ncbi:MAG TPA: hypothetical protein VEM15_01110 [Thermodesulfobacteriota bacterium]|nr:hypothetical protein [Thermodesulfobacteriota bacterium]
MESKKMKKHMALSYIGMTMLLVLVALTEVTLAKDKVKEKVILNQFTTISTVASTIPANGDINPYGVAEVQQSVGSLVAGHILVSNFNNSNNLQGTGSTIVDVAPNGTVKLFAQIDPNQLPGFCPGGVGLTTALVVLRSGWVIVGSLPTTDGMADTAQAGCLIVLDSNGDPVETIFGSLINGPWDMTAFESDYGARLFVTNVLNGTVAGNGQIVNQGTVVRINLILSKNNIPFIESMTVIGSGFPERTDPVALVIGPTGVGLSPKEHHKHDMQQSLKFGEHDGEPEVLYVADSLNNQIVVIPDPLHRTTSAGTGFTLSSGGSLNDPLGLVVAPNGHILTVNGDDGFITEITPEGDQIATALLDNTGSPPGAGTLFGLTFDPFKGIYFVDNGSNTLNLFH